MTFKKFIEKFTSRKFITMVAGVLTAILVYMNVDEGTTQQIIALIGGLASILSYIFVEGSIDKANVSKVPVEEGK